MGSCIFFEYEEIPEGIHTKITGITYDPFLERRIAFAEVGLIGFSNRTGEDIVTIFQTNRYGEFNFSFTTDGEYYAYQLAFINEERFVQASIDTVVTGISSKVTLEARELTNLRLQLSLDTNSVGNISINIDPILAEPPDVFITKTFLSIDRDTSLAFKVFPNQFNRVFFSARDSINNTTYRKEEFVEVGMVTIIDTLEYEIHLEDPRFF